MAAMPFVLLVLLVSVLLGWVAGGRLHRLARIRLHATWLVFAAVAAQISSGALARTGAPVDALARPLLVASQAAVLVFIARNRHQPGMPLVLIGFALNAAVIAANGAMPVAPEAIVALGGTTAVAPGTHHLLTDATLLPWLADVLPVPALRSIVSVGDLVLAAGVGTLVVTRMRRIAAHEPVDGAAALPERDPSED